jgi:hypothetical protein
MPSHRIYLSLVVDRNTFSELIELRSDLKISAAYMSIVTSACSFLCSHPVHFEQVPSKSLKATLNHNVGFYRKLPAAFYQCVNFKRDEALNARLISTIECGAKQLLERERN